MKLGEVIGGRYELEELVGSGGMSSVYRAHDRMLERKVALKILHSRLGEDDEYIERFRREARAVAQLAHPNIVTVIDRGDDEGRQFIVFEYIDGKTLKEVVDAGGPLPVDEVLRLGGGIASGLAFAHGRGIVHRDVKPQNVLLNGDGRAKVTDFGIARSLDVERGVTETGTVLGTSNYIAPEQASGQQVDDRSDVYSLGVVLYELLTGEVPFPGESFVAVAMKHIHEPPPSVLARRPDAPPRLAGLVDAMLEKDHTLRPSMDEVVAELEAMQHGAVGGDDTMVLRRPLPRTRRRRSRWPLLVAVLGLLVIAGAVAGVLLNDQPGGTTAAAPPRLGIEAVSAVDPKGDGEHDSEVPNATDGDVETYWRTSEYRFPGGGFGKAGVGITLETNRPPAAVVVQSDTPGFTADLRSGNTVLAPAQTVGTATTFTLPSGTDATSFVLWITNRGANPAVHVNEVTAR
ncbi:MAG TPA: serine/threonine-protein kinase [Gaiellaceae bacterium]|nr:serine/threonine-protein kinase [Gaiellaceae bacterium]